MTTIIKTRRTPSLGAKRIVKMGLKEEGRSRSNETCGRTPGEYRGTESGTHLIPLEEKEIRGLV